MTSLFKVPIETGGEFECTSPAPKVYLLSFSSPPDNRLTTSFLQAYILALDIIQFKHKRGVLISTSSIAKFFSNGLDLNHVVATPGFLEKSLYPLFQKLLTYPMPTIALINGHAFAGGLMVAMYHDYRIQNPSKGFLCLNEVLFGAIMNSAMVSIFKEKLPSPQTFRTLILEGKRFGAQDALKEGIVDGLGGLEETLKFISERKLDSMGDSGVYDGLKHEMYRHTLNLLRDHPGNVRWRDELDAQDADYKEKALAKIADWEKNAKTSKL